MHPVVPASQEAQEKMALMVQRVPQALMAQVVPPVQTGLPDPQDQMVHQVMIATDHPDQ